MTPETREALKEFAQTVRQLAATSADLRFFDAVANAADRLIQALERESTVATEEADRIERERDNEWAKAEADVREAELLEDSRRAIIFTHQHGEAERG